MPKVTFEFDGHVNHRWLRMTLVDPHNFPADWSIPYEAIEDLAEWFDPPPASGPGLEPDVLYSMDMGRPVSEFAKLLVKLGAAATKHAPAQGASDSVHYTHCEDITDGS